MCGRFKLEAKPGRIAEEFDLAEEPEVTPRYNIAPTQPVLAVVQDRKEPVRHAREMRWGLVPSWATDLSIGNSLINARAESILEKPAFKEAFRKRRCLIPADGFYEWKRAGSTKQPYHFGRADGDVFAFAGVWDRWQSPEGKWIESCSILTTDANALLNEVHDRMPVIVPREQYALWLDPDVEESPDLKEVMRPFDSRQMKGYPVSKTVNSPNNETSACAEEIQPDSDEPQQSLFS
jgi:putative SOS response-associated peptidase YedK